MKKYVYVKTKEKLNDNEYFVLKDKKLKKKTRKTDKKKIPYIKIYKRLFRTWKKSF